LGWARENQGAAWNQLEEEAKKREDGGVYSLEKADICSEGWYVCPNNAPPNPRGGK